MRTINKLYHRTPRPSRAWIACTMQRDCPLCNQAGYQIWISTIDNYQEGEEE